MKITEIDALECAFILHPVDMQDIKFLNSLKFNDGLHLGFVPKSGFQTCKYYNESNTWQSIVTGNSVEVTHVMLPIFEVNQVKPIEYYAFKGLINETGN